METHELEKYIIEILQRLSKMDAKLSTLCSRTEGTDHQVRSLPCDRNMKLFMTELNSRVSNKLLMWLCGIIITGIGAGFLYTKGVDSDLHNHIITKHGITTVVEDKEIP